MSPLAAINLQPGTIMRPSDDYCKQNGGSKSDRYLLIKNRKFTTKQFLRPMMIETQCRSSVLC